jgi:hypothetical protein
MNLSNPLPTPWQDILATRDAIEIARRVVARSPSHPQAECQQVVQIFQQKLREGTVYEGEEALSLLQRRDHTKKEIEGLLVLHLWATFEHFLREYLREKGAVLKQAYSARTLADSLYTHFAKNVERWEPREILDFLKESLFTTPRRQNLINYAQQVLTYRNWVAHANPKRFDNRKDLETVYDTLNDIINILLQH